MLLFVGAIGKSAQIPLFTWLPDAMAGPTPVSALIHAATMVTAGVYMVARSGILYMLAPATLAVVAGIGLATALFAATIALFQNDIKKVLAYSTISQLGYMFLALGAGAFTGAMFHLTTHAFFKALLFLGAGSVIHALGGEQDIRKMGGLSRKLSKTHVTFLAATLAIAGIPPLSGFFSKDEILLNVFSMNAWLWIFAVAGSLLTAFYMFRLYFLTFHGEFRGIASVRDHIHESPNVMTLPMILLAILSLFGGIINIPGILGGTEMLREYLSPVFEAASAVAMRHDHPSHATEWILMGITLTGVLLSIGYAWFYFVKQARGVVADDAPVPPLRKLLSNKYYIDEIYDYLFVRPVMWLSSSLHEVIEIRIIDRIVNGIGNLAIRTGSLLRFVQTGNAGFYMFIMILGVILILVLNILI
jgi:NADH-quinone oxidoreductase subunit L